MTCRQLVIIGNPGNRRVAMFCAAAQDMGFSKPRVIAYEAILAGSVRLADTIPAGSVVRLESPGEDANVERDFIAAGARHSCTSLNDRHADNISAATTDHGLIGAPRRWYVGFSYWLRQIEQQLDARRVAWMNHPEDIAMMFDKLRCQQQLGRHGISVPKLLGAIDDYEDLRQKMRAQCVSRVFVKLLYGSSASGVVALQTSGSRVLATTSVEMVNTAGECKLYNSLRLQQYNDERNVAQLIDALCRRGSFAEIWLPKAGWRGKTFDLRIVMIAGRVRHTVMRTSHGPLTNLHLGNARGDMAELLETLPNSSRQQAWKTCRAVANVFPRSLYCGIDLMFTPRFDKHAVLEVNAFGDLLPNVLCNGLDTYRAELKCLDRWTSVSSRG